MAGINTLHDLYKKKGQAFIESLLDSELTVNEDLNASSFSFEKVPSGDIIFYKKNGSVEITKIDRVLMKYYEAGINYVLTFNQRNPDALPVGFRFCTEYFVSKQPVRILYDEMPKNNMVLTHIQKKDINGKTKSTIEDRKKLNYWADLLDIEKPPIIFQGMLTNTQKARILEFVYTPTDKLIEMHGTSSFTKHIIRILQPKLRKTLLQNSLEKDIEGIVFRFGDIESNNVVLAKVIDPVILWMTKEKKTNDSSTRPSDMFFLALLDINDFMQSFKFNNVVLSRGTFEERYVQFVCQAFNGFIEDRGYKYKDTDFDAPNYIKQKNNQDKFDVNIDLVKNSLTREYIEEEVAYSDLFKIFLNAFKRRRKKEASFFSKDILVHFNAIVDKVHKFIQIKQKNTMVKEGFLNFSRYYEKYCVGNEIDESDNWNDFDYLIEGDDDVVDTTVDTDVDAADMDTEDQEQEKDEEGEKGSQETASNDEQSEEEKTKVGETDDEETDSTEELADKSEKKDKPDPMRILTFWDRSFNFNYRESVVSSDLDDVDDDGNKEEEVVQEDVCMYIGCFQPFHIGDFTNARELQESTKTKILIIDINNGIQSKECPISTQVSDAMMSNLLNTEKGIFAGYMKIQQPLLLDIVDKLDDCMIVKTIAISEERSSSYKKQMNYLKRYSNKSLDDIDVVFTKEYVSNVSVLTALKENDFTTYTSLMPKCMVGFYDVLRQDVLGQEEKIEVVDTVQ